MPDTRVHVFTCAGVRVRVCACAPLPQLYDLMTMGFKYQLVGCTSPVQLLQVTLNHLDSLVKAVEGTPVVELVEEARKLTVAVRC